MCSFKITVPAARGFLALSTALTIACAPSETGSMSAEDPIARGRYLSVIGHCHDCHSPKVFTDQGPVPDTTRLLSGHPADEAIPPLPDGLLGPDGWGAIANNDFTAWAGPWGVTFAVNLTPDPTGLGPWTKEMFIEAMRTGRHMGQGRPILPPMPWPNLAAMTDEDLGALFDYLKSLKPINNAAPQPKPPAPPTP